MLSKFFALGFVIPKYCTKCGQKLVYETVAIEFDILNGSVREYKHNIYCPEALNHNGHLHGNYVWTSSKKWDL